MKVKLDVFRELFPDGNFSADVLEEDSLQSINFCVSKSEDFKIKLSKGLKINGNKNNLDFEIYIMRKRIFKSNWIKISSFI